MKNASKILYGISTLIIIIAIIVVRFNGVNYATEYANGKCVEVYLEKAAEIKEIEEISKEVFGKSVKVNEIERFNDAYAIYTSDVSDEQTTNLVNKINEKYSSKENNETTTEETQQAENTEAATETPADTQTENSETTTEENNGGITKDNIKIIDIPKISGYDLVKVYIKPTIISLVLILIYLTIRYRKHGNIINAITTIFEAGLITGLYFGVVILTRQPIVNMYTIPIGLVVALISLFIVCYNNELEIRSEDNKKENKE